MWITIGILSVILGCALIGSAIDEIRTGVEPCWLVKHLHRRIAKYDKELTALGHEFAQWRHERQTELYIVRRIKAEEAKLQFCESVLSFMQAVGFSIKSGEGQ